MFLLIAAALLHMLAPCGAIDFYVTPSNLTCSETDCYILNQYAQNLSLFEGHTNITLLFLNGEHNLTHDFNIAGLDSLVLRGLDHSSSVYNIRAMIHLRAYAEISVTNVTTFGMYNIGLKGKITYDDDNLFYYTRGLCLTLSNVVNITQDQVEIQKMDVKIYSERLLEQSTVIRECNYRNSTLAFSSTTTNEVTVQILKTNIYGESFSYSNVRDFRAGLQYTCSQQTSSENERLAMDIQDSNILGWVYGVQFYCDHFYSMIITNTNIVKNEYGISMSNLNMGTVVIESSKFANNDYGIRLFRLEVHTFTVNNTAYTNNTYGFIAYNTHLRNMLVRDSAFSHNDNIGMYISSETEIKVINIAIFGTNISHNKNFGIFIQSSTRIHQTQPLDQTLLLQKCTIASNHAAGIALIHFKGNTTFRDSKFHYNKGTPVIAYNSDIELSGEMSFIDNVAAEGGALSLVYSTVTFTNNSNIIFQNNTARKFGGAIFVVSSKIQFPDILLDTEFITGVDDPPPRACFYHQQPGTTAQVHFANNSATLGGKDIYGASSYDDRCNMSNDTFKFTESVSSITSEATRVCFCSNSSSQFCDKETMEITETRFPGEKFNISVILVGYNYGTVSGTVYANLIGSNYKAVFDDNQHTQTTNFSKCTNFEITISSNKSTEIIVLTAEETNTQHSSIVDIQREKFIDQRYHGTPFENLNLLSALIYVNVTLEECPLGFAKNENFRCVCDDNLKGIDTVTCEIQNHVGYINRENTLWVGVDESRTNSDYLLNSYCPYNYCTRTMTHVELTQPDTQCNDNRTGLLCGQCKPGYSLLLGSNKCQKCTNSGIALLVFFFAAGLSLVFLIKILNLTVANGTINGLIFYANVLWGYNMLLPPPNTQSPLHWILTVPIAWINLDFGFETCFFDGMNAFWKTWLQFAFPLYLWSIAGLIILTSHYSERATKLFGNNSAAILATLFLLSYGKLLRNTIIIITNANMLHQNGSTARNVWAFDGNLEYGNSVHGILFVVGLLVLLLLWLPYTLALFLVPLLRSRSHLKPLRWIDTMKPFFDTYYGPFNDNVQYHCWTGILLLVRGVLLVSFAITSTIIPNTNLLLTNLLIATALVLLLYCAMVGMLYKKWYLSLMDNLYILNLGILGGAYLFDSETDASKYPIATAVSISLALFQFTIILIIHLVKRCIPKRYVEINKLPDLSQSNIKNELQEVSVQLSYNDRRFRESLFEYTQ